MAWNFRVTSTVFDGVEPPSEDEKREWEIERAKQWTKRARSTLNKDAAKGPRPKKSPTHKTITVAAMKQWRRGDNSLADFMDAAANGSIDGLTIRRAEASGVKRFDVDCDAMKEKQRVSKRTLQEWWEAAGAD